MFIFYLNIKYSWKTVKDFFFLVCNNNLKFFFGLNTYIYIYTQIYIYSFIYLFTFYFYRDDNLLDEDLGDDEYDLGNDEEEALLADDNCYERVSN